MVKVLIIFESDKGIFFAEWDEDIFSHGVIFVKFAAACGALFNVAFCKTISFYSFNSVLNEIAVIF